MNSAESSRDVKAVVEANTGFAFQLLKQLSDQDKTNNVFFSPFSVSSALSMCLNGSAGDTRKSIADTLGLVDIPLPAVNNGSKTLLGFTVVSRSPRGALGSQRAVGG